MLIAIVHRLIWVFFQPVVGVCTKQAVLNREKILQEKLPVIFVSNHESHFDPFLISGSMPFWGRMMPIRFFTRDIFFVRPMFRRLLRLLGAFPGGIGWGVEHAAEKPVGLLRQGFSIGIFPEWCFPDEPESSRMQSVAGYISRESGSAIIPMFLYGIHGMSWGKIFSLKNKNIVSFGDPIHPDEGESLLKYTERVNRGLLLARLQCIRHLREGEHEFWLSYARFYKYLELAAPYERMLYTIRALIPDTVRGKWLDIGTGSGAMVELLLGASGRSARNITATDFSDEMLALAEERFRGNAAVQVEKLDLNHALPYAANSFNGVIANLVLTYITHHETMVGRKVFGLILGQMFRVLKPGGILIFSTPKREVNFMFVAIASWRSFFDRKHPEYRSYALSILKHALKIQEWGRREVFHFPSLSELENIVHKIGFHDIQIEVAMAGQVYVVSCRKPAVHV